MENIQQAAKPSAMMNEAPMNHLTLSDRLKSYKRTPGSFLAMLLVVLSAVATIAALVFLILYILVNGIPYINADLFSWTYTSENCSVVPAAINTVIMAGISLLLAVPFGIGSAIYLVEYAKKGNKLVKVIRVTAETLTGIPSIVYGLFGMLFFVTALKWKFSILAGAFTLAIMVLPVTMRTTEEALLAVPDSLPRRKFWTWSRESCEPSLKSFFRQPYREFLAGVILATGRMVGETAALIYTAGTRSRDSKQSIISREEHLAVHMYSTCKRGTPRRSGVTPTAVVLLIRC